MTSADMRKNPFFMRNNVSTTGKYGIPLICASDLLKDDIKLVACSDTRNNDLEINCHKGVHFFVDDYRFEGTFLNPERSIKRYSQYDFLLSPDFSLYGDMPIWRQIENVAKNRWVGAYWQSKGLIVIPTVSWSTPRSFDFCFDGIEKNSPVAIGMIGSKNNRNAFLSGYYEMIKKLSPSQIIVFGTPFDEMLKDNLLVVDYWKSKKVVR